MTKLVNLETMSRSNLTELDSRDAIFLLGKCFAIPRLTHLLRSLPCFLSSNLDLYEEKYRYALKDILNYKIDEKGWDRASLPVKYGGLRMRIATDVALHAFHSSYNATAPLRDQTEASFTSSADYLSNALNH